MQTLKHHLSVLLFCAAALPAMAQADHQFQAGGCDNSYTGKTAFAFSPADTLNREAQRYYGAGGYTPPAPYAELFEDGSAAMRIIERGMTPCQLTAVEQTLRADQNWQGLLARTDSEAEVANLMGVMAYGNPDTAKYIAELAAANDDRINWANFASFANLAETPSDYCRAFQPALSSAYDLAARQNLAMNKIEFSKITRWRADNSPDAIQSIREELQATLEGRAVLSDQSVFFAAPLTIGNGAMYGVFPNGVATLPANASADEVMRWYFENGSQKPPVSTGSDLQNGFFYYASPDATFYQSIGWFFPGDIGNGGVQSVGGFNPGTINICGGGGGSRPTFDNPIPDTKNSSDPSVPCNSDTPDATPCFLAAVSLSDAVGNVQCSGALVSPDWVLTAAHCVCRGGLINAHIGQKTPTPDDPSAQTTATTPLRTQACFFGETDCQSFDTQMAGQFCAVDRILAQGVQLNPQRIQRHYRLRDLALIHLSNPLQFDQNDQVPAEFLQGAITTPIGHPDAVVDGQVFAVSGFGRNDAQRRGGKKSHAPIQISALNCGDTSTCITGQEFVLDDPDRNVDSCSGDSGAGVYGPSSEGLALYGIVSRGVAAGCGAGGINTLVATPRVIDWITSVTSTARVVSSPEIFALNLTIERIED